MDKNGWKWMKMDKNGWKNGWKWIKMVENWEKWKAPLGNEAKWFAL